MPVYALSYDLYHESGRSYEALYAALQKFPENLRVVESTWLVSTSWSPKQICDYLTPHLHSKDKLIINQVGQGWWSHALPDDVRRWLHRVLKTTPNVTPVVKSAVTSIVKPAIKPNLALNN